MDFSLGRDIRAIEQPKNGHSAARDEQCRIAVLL
jgi:hypothetical protein